MQFLTLFRKYITYHSVSNVHYEKRKPVTIQAYNNKYNLVNAFLFEKGKMSLSAQHFSISLSKELLEWSNSKYSHNYSVRIVEICKDVLDFGIENEHIKSHQLPVLRLKRLPPKKIVYLNPEELEKLERYQPNTSTKEKAKDLFLLQCYTGMAYTDIVSVTEWNVHFYKGRRYILKKRNKTSVESFIPYNDIIEGILKKYNFQMKILSNVNFNAALKDIADDLEISKHLTTHIGRKTFAMISLNWYGYGMEAVSAMLGISIRTAEKHYAQVGLNLVSNEQDRLQSQTKLNFNTFT